MPPKNSRKSSQKLVFSIPVLPGQRRQRHDPSRSFPVDLHGSTRFTQVGLPFPVLQGSPRWFLTCQKPPERPPVHPGPPGIIPVHHGGTTVQPPVLPGSSRSMDRGEPGSTGSPVGLMHYVMLGLLVVTESGRGRQRAFITGCIRLYSAFRDVNDVIMTLYNAV